MSVRRPLPVLLLPASAALLMSLVACDGGKPDPGGSDGGDGASDGAADGAGDGASDGGDGAADGASDGAGDGGADGGDGGGDGVLPEHTFANPTELAPDADGVYRLRFAPAAVELDGRRFCLRTYNGAVPGPTIRAPAGADRRLHIDLTNTFTDSDHRYIAGMEGKGARHCNDFNLTNLHFHGGHIRPDYAQVDASDPCTGDGCADGGRYYGDNVFVKLSAGMSARYRWDLDEDGPHHEGTQWYHPHIHGTTAVQVTNGAAGALIVEGPLDALPGIAEAPERLLVMNQIPVNSERVTALADGEACTEDNLSVNNFLAITEYMPTFINGLWKPRIVTPPGQVERWRFIHAGNPDEMGLTLRKSTDPTCETFSDELVDMVQIARDGLTLPQFYDNPNDTVWMSPGYRVDALVKMPDEEGTLCLVDRRVRDLDGTAIAIIAIDRDAGAPTVTELPAEAAVGALSPATTFTAKLGGVEQEVSCDSTAARPYDQRVVLLVPENIDEGSTVDEDAFVMACDPAEHGSSHTGPEVDPNPLPIDATICGCPSPNINCRNFDTRRSWEYRADRVMTVNTAEKWEITAFDGHPFHIHINPFLVCPNDSNKEPNFAHWRDTFWVQIEDRPRDVLTHFKTFPGAFVLHCHKLNHEDEGMMEVVEICNEGDTDCLCAGTDSAGACIPMGGCLEDDKQCQFAALATESYPLPPVIPPGLCPAEEVGPPVR